MINNIPNINHNDTNKSYHNQDLHNGEEHKRKKLELNTMRGLGYYDAKMSMIHGHKGFQETRSTHGQEKPERNTFISTTEYMKAKFNSVLSGVKTAEEKESSGTNQVDIRITEDGAMEKVRATSKGSKEDTAVIVELSRSAKYASCATTQPA